MKQIIGVAIVAVLAALMWRITGHISSDALALAIGVVFGVLAGLPTAILVLASNRRREHGPGRILPPDRHYPNRNELRYPPQQNYIVMMPQQKQESQRPVIWIDED